MKVICTQENLKNGLLTVARIISTSNTLPILNNILLKTENGLLKVSATNLEVAISTHIRCKVEEEGGITVFSKTITELVNNLPNKNIVLNTEAGEMHIETENYHTTVKTMPADEFPLIPEPEGFSKFTIPAQQLKEAINQVVFAASTNQTQQEISGIYMNVEGKTVTLTATDRYRLAERRIDLPNDSGVSQQVIIPHKTVLELSRIIATNEMVELLLSETQIACTLGSSQIISRLIDGQYPPYREIIPQSFTTTIHTQKQALMNALKAGGIFSQGTNSIRLEYNTEKQLLTITSESQDLGKSVVDIPSEIEGGSGELILNHKYVIDCLTTIDSANVVIKIIDENAPSLILAEGKSDYLYLVMPIKS